MCWVAGYQWGWGRPFVGMGIGCGYGCLVVLFVGVSG